MRFYPRKINPYKYKQRWIEKKERLGFVGKKEEINPFTGKKHIVDYDSEDEIGCTASVFSMKEWLAISNRSGNGKLKT